MRLIDVDALPIDIQSDDTWTVMRGRVREWINSVPAVDAVEVKHARNICDTVKEHCEFKCSLCGVEIGIVEGGVLDGGIFYYCPNCGAKLDDADATTIDTVEVVRCRDCKYNPRYMDDWFDEDHCVWTEDQMPEDNDYCSYGERKNDRPAYFTRQKYAGDAHIPERRK